MSSKEENIERELIARTEKMNKLIEENLLLKKQLDSVCNLKKHFVEIYNDDEDDNI